MNQPSLLRRSKSHRMAAVRNVEIIGRKTTRRLTIVANREDGKDLLHRFQGVGIKVVHAAPAMYGHGVRMVLEMRGNQVIDTSGSLFQIEKDERIRIQGTPT